MGIVTGDYHKAMQTLDRAPARPRSRCRRTRPIATCTCSGLSIDAGELLDLLAEAVPNGEVRHAILAHNPERLYGF